jgi:hypothetical protein
MKELPLDPRGYAIPYFVKWLDGKPDFRISDMDRVYACVTRHLCMICGKKMPSQAVYVLGPISAVTRTNDEPGMPSGAILAYCA